MFKWFWTIFSLDAPVFFENVLLFSNLQTAENFKTVKSNNVCPELFPSYSTETKIE